MSKKNENEEEEIKVILIGDSGVGKTNLINTSVGLKFNQAENPTVSGSFVSKNIIINDKKYIFL
jgi:GTPase SAR1 family protein